MSAFVRSRNPNIANEQCMLSSFFYDNKASNCNRRLFSGRRPADLPEDVTSAKSLRYDTIEEFNVDSKAEYTA